MSEDKIQKEIDELEFELCHEVGLLTRVKIEERIKYLKMLRDCGVTEEEDEIMSEVMHDLD